MKSSIQTVMQAALSMGIIGGVLSALAQNPLEGYNFRMKLSVTNLAQVTASQTDFPVLVKLSEANFAFSHANNAGLDVRFTAADGQTLLDFDRERHSRQDRQAEYWVKLPAVSSTVATSFYLYYGGAASDGAVGSNVWSTSRFSMVQHLGGTHDVLLDSTSTGNHLINVGGTTTVEGKIGRGLAFNGSSAFLITNTIARPPNGGLAMWMKWNGNPTGNRYLVRCWRNNGDGTAYSLSINANSNLVSYIHSGNNTSSITNTTVIVPGQWYYVYGRWGNGGHALYVNGVLTAANEYKGFPYLNWWIERQMFGYQFEGTLDEIQTFSSFPQISWVSTQYASHEDRLVEYGEEEDFGPKATIVTIR